MGRVSAGRDGICIGPKGANADAVKQDAHARRARKRGIMELEKRKAATRARVAAGPIVFLLRFSELS